MTQDTCDCINLLFSSWIFSWASWRANGLVHYPLTWLVGKKYIFNKIKSKKVNMYLKWKVSENKSTNLTCFCEIVLEMFPFKMYFILEMFLFKRLYFIFEMLSFKRLYVILEMFLFQRLLFIHKIFIFMRM